MWFSKFFPSAFVFYSCIKYTIHYTKYIHDLYYVYIIIYTQLKTQFISNNICLILFVWVCLI